jgi:hypothetical protein
MITAHGGKPAAGTSCRLTEDHKGNKTDASDPGEGKPMNFSVIHAS